MLPVSSTHAYREVYACPVLDSVGLPYKANHRYLTIGPYTDHDQRQSSCSCPDLVQEHTFSLPRTFDDLDIQYLPDQLDAVFVPLSPLLIAEPQYRVRFHQIL